MLYFGMVALCCAFRWMCALRGSGVVDRRWICSKKKEVSPVFLFDVCTRCYEVANHMGVIAVVVNDIGVADLGP